MVNIKGFMLGIEGISLGSHLMLIVSSNDTGHFKSHSLSWNPRDNVKSVQSGIDNNHEERNYITTKTSSNALCTLIQQQAAPAVDMEKFDGNLLNYHYFMALFSKVVEAKIKVPKEDWSSSLSLQLEKHES